MTSTDRLQRDLPRLLANLVESPLPDDLEAALTRTASVRQRPSWAILDRWHPRADTYFRYAAASAAVGVLAVAGIALLGTQSGRIAAETSPPTSGAPSPTAPWTSEACRPVCAGPLIAGSHTSRAFEPAVTYTLTSQWINLEDGGVYLLYPDTQANRALAAAGGIPPQLRIWSGPLRIFPDERVTGPPSDNAVCADDRPGDVVPRRSNFVEVDAAQFHEYLATLEGVTTTAPIPVTVSGLTGQQIDVTPVPGSMTCLPGTSFAAVTAQADRYRYIFLDTPEGDSLLIALWAPTDFDAFLAAAMPVVESMQFDLAP